MTDATSPHPIEAAEPDAAGQRSRHRDSLFLAARLRVGAAAAIDVRVRNLSEGGLMVEGAPPLPIGAEVVIELRNIGPVPGKVAWYTDDRAGVAFDAPIDPKKARKPVATRAASATVTARKTFAC